MLFWTWDSKFMYFSCQKLNDNAAALVEELLKFESQTPIFLHVIVGAALKSENNNNSHLETKNILKSGNHSPLR